MSKKYICIHGHFYQPPRENAWLEEVEVQDSAAPFHDWNERITAECYGPNTASRILDEGGVIRNILNNYSRISFNFGPTLLSWLEENDPDAYSGILEADKLSEEYFSGHGSAMAQVYNHIILPLANSRDKETQIVWGIQDFVHRFGRQPEGMWLAETAVDNESLKLMARHGIRFTILAPWQLKHFRKKGDTEWEKIKDGKEVYNRPYRIDLGDGDTIAVFFYNGEISSSVAFNNLLANGKDFASKILSGFTNTETPQIVHIATDGESYGHHHAHGDMALAYCIDYIERTSDAHITNYGEYLEKFPPEWEAEVIEDTSWSCIHGVGRWKENCGCHTGGNPGWNQKWRQHLRDSLNWLNEQLITIYEEQSVGLLKNPWEARDHYISVILDRSAENTNLFLQRYAAHYLYPETEVKILRLLEMQRHALLMFTSCGWFFDDISGIETVQILQYACRAMQLAYQVDGEDLEEEFLKRLSKAVSNDRHKGNGAHIYQAEVVPARLDLERVGMHYAITSVFEERIEQHKVFNYEVENIFFDRKHAGLQSLAVGTTGVRAIATHSNRRFSFAVLYFGQHQILGNISTSMDEGTFRIMHHAITEAFDEGRLGDVIGLMQSYFGPKKYTIWHLFKDEKRKVLDGIMEQSLRKVENSFRTIFHNDYQLLSALKRDGIPLPSAYTTTIEFVLNMDLIKFFRTKENNLLEIQALSEEFKKWNVSLDKRMHFDFFAGERIFTALKSLTDSIEDIEKIRHLNEFFDLLKGFDIKPNLDKSQNLYFRSALERSFTNQACVFDPEWQKEFALLGKNLKVKMSGSVLDRKDLSHTN